MKSFTIEELEDIAQQTASDPMSKAKRMAFIRVFSPDVVGVLLDCARRGGIHNIQIFEYLNVAPEVLRPKFDA